MKKPMLLAFMAIVFCLVSCTKDDDKTTEAQLVGARYYDSGVSDCESEEVNACTK